MFLRALIGNHKYSILRDRGIFFLPSSEHLCRLAAQDESRYGLSDLYTMRTRLAGSASAVKRAFESALGGQSVRFHGFASFALFSPFDPAAHGRPLLCVPVCGRDLCQRRRRRLLWLVSSSCRLLGSSGLASVEYARGFGRLCCRCHHCHYHYHHYFLFVEAREEAGRQRSSVHVECDRTRFFVRSPFLRVRLPVVAVYLAPTAKFKSLELSSLTSSLIRFLKNVGLDTKVLVWDGHSRNVLADASLRSTFASDPSVRFALLTDYQHFYKRVARALRNAQPRSAVPVALSTTLTDGGCGRSAESDGVVAGDDDAGDDDAGDDDAGDDDASEDDAGEDDAGEDDAGDDELSEDGNDDCANYVAPHPSPSSAASPPIPPVTETMIELATRGGSRHWLATVDGTVEFGLIKRLYDADVKLKAMRQLPNHKRLTRASIAPRSVESMSVSGALALFDRNVSASVAALGAPNSAATATFLVIFADLYAILNQSCEWASEGRRVRSGRAAGCARSPLRFAGTAIFFKSFFASGGERERVLVLREKLFVWLGWCGSASPSFFRPLLARAVFHVIDGFVEAGDLLARCDDAPAFFLPRSLNSDCIESFFGVVRQGRGAT